MEKVDIRTLVGHYNLSGVEIGHGNFNDDDGAENNGNWIMFVLDNKTYKAVEDVNDGYRSCMDEIFVVDDVVKNRFAPVHVFGVYDRIGDGYHDTVSFYSVSGDVVLEVGTDNKDDYYPCFIAFFNPKVL